MSQKENVAATWDDMDWGQPDPATPSAIAPVRPAASAQVEIAPQPAPATPPAPTPAENPEIEQQRLQVELERVKMEAELARMKAELMEQQRQLEAQQAKAVETPRTMPLRQDPSVVHCLSAAGAVIFNPQSLATLTLEVEGGRQVVVTVKNPFTVGRNKGNDLVIRDLHVSSQHAKFAARKDGVFEVTDLNSSGGTFVNGRRVERCELKSGDKVEFATVPATFRYVAGGLLDPEDEIEGTLVQSKAAAARKLAAVPRTSRHGILTVLTADEKSRNVTEGGQITIGRSPDNDLTIAEKHVSGRHARLAGNVGGGFELFDLRSSCGTFVNGVQVQHWVLRSNDRIRFGVVDCIFTIIDAGEGEKDAVIQRPLPPQFPSLPQVEDSGGVPLPQPKPVARGGPQMPLIR